MRYMLDTDTCIEILRGRAPAALARLVALKPADVGVSAITLAELRFGAAKSVRRGHHESVVAAFCGSITVADFDSNAASIYGALRSELESKGTPIGAPDMLIAAHALSLAAVVITGNVREFRKVPGLSVENWRG
jgi:tRNA(fMet)-specific endonuclease VapC